MNGRQGDVNDPVAATLAQVRDEGRGMRNLPALPPKILAWAEETAGLFSKATGCTFTIRTMHGRPEEPSVGCVHLTPDFAMCKQTAEALKAGRDDVPYQIGVLIGHTAIGIAAMHRHELAFALIAAGQYGDAKQIPFQPEDACALCTAGEPGLTAKHVRRFIKKALSMRRGG